MKRMFGALALAVAGALLMAHAGAIAQEAVQPIELTAQQVEGFIAAHEDMAPLTEKLERGRRPGAKARAQLDETAKKHGFKDFDEYNAVASNIAVVVAGFDPETKTFVPPQDALKKQIEEVSAETGLSSANKSQILGQLEKALKAAQKAAHPTPPPGNIKLIEQYFEQLESVLE